MTAPHDPGPQLPPSQVESLAQSVIAAFQSIADNIQQVTGMTPQQLQAAMDELPDDQKMALMQRITGSLPQGFGPPTIGPASPGR